jgi:hypothetical protein
MTSRLAIPQDWPENLELRWDEYGNKLHLFGEIDSYPSDRLHYAGQEGQQGWSSRWKVGVGVLYLPTWVSIDGCLKLISIDPDL